MVQKVESNPKPHFVAHPYPNGAMDLNSKQSLLGFNIHTTTFPKLMASTTTFFHQGTVLKHPENCNQCFKINKTYAYSSKLQVQHITISFSRDMCVKLLEGPIANIILSAQDFHRGIGKYNLKAHIIMFRTSGFLCDADGNKGGMKINWYRPAVTIFESRGHQNGTWRNEPGPVLSLHQTFQIIQQVALIAS